MKTVWNLSDASTLLPLSHTPCCPRHPQATLSAHVVLGLIPLQLALVLAWMCLGQVVPNPKRMNGIFPLLGLLIEPGLPPRASRDHSVQVRMEFEQGRFTLTIPLVA